MANYYSVFCIVLPLPNDFPVEDVTKFYHQWTIAKMELYQSDLYDVKKEMLYSFSMEQNSDGELVLYADESFDLDGLADFIQLYLQKFDMDGLIYFSWADYCSKNRPHSAAGGSCLVGKDSFKWLYVNDIITDELNVLNRP